MSRFAELAFTGTVREVQAEQGSATAMARMLGPADSGPDALGPAEAAFLTERDGVYLATVGDTGWPYVQHRGGPPGFLHVLDEHTLGFVDVRGNRQFVSAGNLRHDDRVAVFAMDYAGQRRLKLLGRAEVVALDADPELTARLSDVAADGTPERVVLIHVEGVQRNCPQHITPRWSEAELVDALAPMRERIAELEAEVARLR
ncbi:pyridoxamine 5'-phosphate oxidase family protein [Pseudonocardia sp. KRD-184]|uniref:Pyridoxamine 5'-phosphate oxidase family protein n=1 Tax=Pseudonocardia oceani TaxID=2792013 RepID=A0ABS6U3L1_9PSEU|nr:pyridoxamine 5'-phosphate oxidase family protein [Pseudonocardia oceani]MBW0093169.1 pyridoxamine 5'-phosphate oxidase family protein [Pseudonocardia oceani]MBW0098898.1 pyridoxamine 5'-phosphate oxidase family protein [Pseudonocardia oceani]MBW0111903.1 pyridoxamine 5'-phosphate oxidase family protein [Pseudonocardia oceani]MBW0124448.1 pyridoxamine 5'-phosphate oxidase family protein [Pseudonocardia oceani]MBW0126805.1 pyridoxamine 5'-phosphate oxidase family protein [Pseudonocardia ocean